MFNWFKCRGCEARRDEIEDLRAERNLLRAELISRLGTPTPQVNRSAAEQFKPIPMAKGGWNKFRSKLEDKFKKTSNEDKVKNYWDEKNAKLEAEVLAASSPDAVASDVVEQDIKDLEAS
jgi:hypothetical protein